MATDGNSITIIMSLVSGILGSIIGVFGSMWIANKAVKRQEKEKEMVRIQDRLEAYSSLWRFLKESNNRAKSHPSFKQAKQYTHVFNSPTDYERLSSHFISPRSLLSEKTYLLYLESFSKDKFGIASVANSAPNPIPTNYMALQDEVREMCDSLKVQISKSAKRNL